MPAGELFTREIRSCEPPEDLHRRVVVQLSPLLAPANYKLAAQDAQNVHYSRRYIPTALLVASVGVIALVAIAHVAGDGGLMSTLLGLLGVGILSFARRREALTVSVRPRPGGSTAVLSGYLTGRARMALLGFDPPQGRRLRIAPTHPQHPERVGGGPLAG
jgi:hypothetical protein